MQTVIEIPDRIYKIVQNRMLNITDAEILEKAVKNGTPLPKGHGRLIDADDVDNHIIGHVDLRSCPTIIEDDVLDKIIAEIENTEIKGYIRDVECYNAGINFALHIIAKYKTESKEGI